MISVHVRHAGEFDCPDCGKMGFVSDVVLDATGLHGGPNHVTCKHCGCTNVTAEDASFEEPGAMCDDFVWLRSAWEFDCSACGKLSYASLVSYRPPLESEQGNVKIQIMEFKPPNEILCQHCGIESQVEPWRH